MKSNVYVCLTNKGKRLTKLKQNIMKTFNNTTMICLTLGLLTGSVLAGLMIDTNWFVLSIIFGLAFGIFYTTHGDEKISHAIRPRTQNTFKK